MSSTIYDSPDDAPLSLSIDITYGTVWFFQGDTDPLVSVRVAKTELPAVYAAIGHYLKGEDYGGDHDV